MRAIPQLDDLTHYPSWLLVGRVHVKCQHLLHRGLSELRLSVAKYEVLHAIYRDEGLSQQRLARRLLVAKSNVTVLCQRLEKDGLIRRERDPEDGRGHCVVLSEKGRKVVEAAVEVHAGVVELMARDLTEEQAAVLDHIMGQVEENLDAAAER
ncbi:MAG: MarR family transcriptional regulator [Pseudomonadota bacterium]